MDVREADSADVRAVAGMETERQDRFVHEGLSMADARDRC
jgi:hypothetical protein